MNIPIEHQQILSLLDQKNWSETC